MAPISLTPLGILHAPYQETAGMPIQAVRAVGAGNVYQARADDRFA
jgi:hypothetical protein